MSKIILSTDRDQRLEQIKEKFYRSLPDNKKERMWIPKTEIRLLDDEEKGPQLRGYGAVFNKNSEGLWFIEKIAKGTFEESIAHDDVVGLFNHDRNIVLGRTSAGTMLLVEDETGLLYTIDLPETQSAKDIHISVKRGDIKGSSFSFKTQKDQWEYLDDGDTVIRTLLKVKLFDVGPVTFPAYPDTTTGARSLNDWLNEQNAVIGKITWRRNLARRRLEIVNAAMQN